MKKISYLSGPLCLLPGLISLVCLMLSSPGAFAQLYRPEGLTMPGSWNGYGNWPNRAMHFALANNRTDNDPPYALLEAGGIHVVGGPWAGSISRYRTTIVAAATGGDVTGGTYDWKFTSGPSGNAWVNQWAGVTTAMNTVQTYPYCNNCNPGGNTITLVDGNTYTMNISNGYGDQKAIFMVTSAAPVGIANVVQNPVAGSVTPSDNVDLTITLSAAKSAEEHIYVRYSIDGFSTGNFIEAAGSGTSYTAQIPAQADGSTVVYYAFTSTVALGTLTNQDADLYTLNFRNAGGGSPYSYASSSVPPVNVTFTVDMQNETVSQNGVHVSGNFNGYNTATNQLTQVGATSIYTTTLPLPANSSISYKFVNGNANGNYEADVSGACGTGNRTYAIGATDASIPSTCYGVCGACPATHQITFEVDMAFETFTSVSISGTFNNYNTTANPLTQVGSSSLYRAILTLAEGQNYSYKFVKNGGTYEADMPTGACNPPGSGDFNRHYTVGTSDATVATSCFGLCGACTPHHLVTFRVDMGSQTGYTGVTLSGTFNGYNTGANPMTQVGSSTVYQTTLNLVEGQDYSYKFVKDGVSYENDIPTGSCNPPGSGDFNRHYTVGAVNAILPINCYGICGSCPIVTPITFRVNMAGQTVSTGVSLSGTFNGWNTTSHPLTQIGATGVWQATISLPASTSIQYKFVNSGSYENPIVGPCNISTNRAYNVGTVAAALPTVCFHQCIDCGATNEWVGVASTNFTQPSNWSAGVVPSGCSANIQILNVTNKPSLASGTVSLGNVSFASGASLNVASGATLSVCGNITGGYIAGLGNLEFTGPGTQSCGLGGGKANMQDISIVKSSGSVTVTSGTLSVSGTLSLSASSTLNVAGGSVVLASGSSGTGRLAQVPVGAVITGNLTVERKLPGATGWYFVAAPVTAASTLTQWSELPARVAPANNANVVCYTENDSSYVSGPGTSKAFTTGWRPPSALSNAINPGGEPRGYRVYQNAAFVSVGGKLSVTGAPRIGNVVANFSFTPAAPGGYDGGGWNLLGNPFPSEIDWNAVVTDPTNASAPSGNAINIYNGATKTYATWTATGASTGISVNGGARYIASSQAFFIKATATGSLTFKESHKDAANPNTFMRAAESANVLRLMAYGHGYSDEAALAWMDDARSGRDRYDADKMDGEEISLSILPAAGLSHAISAMPEPATRDELPLRLTSRAEGSHTLVASGLSSFAAGTRFYLRDAYTGRLTELLDGTVYPFQISADPASQGESRFALVAQPASVTGTVQNVSQAQLSAWPVPASAKTGRLNVRTAGLGSGLGTLVLMDALGRTVIGHTAEFRLEEATAEMEIGRLPQGVYTLKATGSGASATRQIVVE